MVDQFCHEALLYRGLAEFMDEACGFVREGLDREERVLVATTGERLAGLRVFFGAEPEVRFADLAEVGGNPARIIPLWQEFLDDSARAGRPVRGLGEPAWPGRSEPELAECGQHESLINVAFDGGPGWRLLCPYDVAGLPGEVVEEARANHPVLLAAGHRSASAAYRPERPSRALRRDPLPPSPAGVLELPFAIGDLAAVRRTVRRAGTEAALDGDRADDLVLAVDEVATNSLLHGGGRGVLRLWRDPQALVCEVADEGTIPDPLVGRAVPPLDRVGGRGLWLAHQLSDLVQIRSGPGGTVVRLHASLPADAAPQAD